MKIEIMYVSVCQLYMDPFSFFPPKYCRVRGGALHSGFWVRRYGSTPLRKLWDQCQRVATSLSKGRTSATS